MITRGDIDEALGRLEAVALPRLGRRATAQVLKGMTSMLEMRHVLLESVLQSIHATLDAYARIPESGTPFPLGVAKAIGDLGCLRLSMLNWRMHGGQPPPPLEMLDVEARGVAQHADLLLNAYGPEDAEFAVRVAWKHSHHHRLNLVVGRCTNRNDPSPTTILDEAWRAQGARGIPLAAVPAELPSPGVIYALGPPPSENVLERTKHTGFVFEPDHGDPTSLDDIRGVQRFLAKNPLPITPQSLAWLVHLLRFACPGKLIDVDHRLTVQWEALEEGEQPSAASLLMGIRPPPPETREKVTIKVGDDVLTYVKGELSY